jgi:hypothetical protein
MGRVRGMGMGVPQTHQHHDCRQCQITTTSMGSSSSNHTLGSLNDRREEPTLGPNDPVPSYWENRSHGLHARPLLTLKEPDLPQVESNLNESPQEYLAVTVMCIEV